MNALTLLQEIKTVPASIVFDYGSVKALVVAHLERYQNIVLTEDDFKEGKDLIKEINSTRKALEDARKSEVAKASEPIKAFEANIKELVALHDELKKSLQVQIEKFEAEKKEEIRAAIAELQQSEWAAQGVRAEFQNSQTNHLVLLGSFTAGGKLTAKAQGEVKQLVSNDKALQQQTDLRLSQLETLCYKAGLAAPLNKSHVSHFLLDDEVTYQTKLNALLVGELEREKEAVAFRKAQELKAQEQAELNKQLEQQHKQQQETQPVERPSEQLVEQQPVAQAIPAQQEQPIVQNEQSTRVTVTVSFTLDIPVFLGNEAIAKQLDTKLKSSGFSTHKIESVIRG